MHVLIAQGPQNAATSVGYGGDGPAGIAQGVIELPAKAVKVSQRQG